MGARTRIVLWSRTDGEADLHEMRKIKIIDRAVEIIIRWVSPATGGDEIVLCEDCGIYPADLPSKHCPGCEAYKEHQWT